MVHNHVIIPYTAGVIAKYSDNTNVINTTLVLALAIQMASETRYI